MNIPSDENLKKLKKDQILIGVLNPYSNEQKLKDTIAKILIVFHLSSSHELLEPNQWIFYHLKLI